MILSLSGDPTFGASSDLHGEDCDNTDVGGLAQLDGDQAIRCAIPIGARSWGNRRSIVLLDDACHHVLEFFLELGKILDAGLNDLLGPLVDSLTLVLDLIGTNDVVDGLLGDALHGLGIELVLVLKVGHLSTLVC